MKNSKNLFFAMGLLFVGSCFKINGITVDTIRENKKDDLIACHQKAIDLIREIEQERLRIVEFSVLDTFKNAYELTHHLQGEYLRGKYESLSEINRMIKYFVTVEQMQLTVLLHTKLTECRNLSEMMPTKDIDAL